VTRSGAAEIVAVCDLAIAVDEARFSHPEARLGAAPVQFAGAAQATIPLKWAKAMALGGLRVSASDALRHGLLTEVVGAEQLTGAVGDWVADIRRAPAHAVRHTKRILNQELREVGLPRMEHALRNMLGDLAV